MTGEVLGPNAGITSRWTPGSDGWGGGMDRDLDALDALLFVSVLSAALAAPPTSPAAGDRYIVATGGSGAWAGHDKSLAVFRDAAWTFYAPYNGWTAYNAADATDYRFNGTIWVPALKPYEVQAYAPSLPAAGAVLFSVLFRQKVVFPAAMQGSAAAAKDAATAAASLSLKRNGVQFATVNFAAGAVAATFTSAATTTFNPDDVLDCLVPAADATLARVSIALLGLR